MSTYTGAPFPASCALDTELLECPLGAKDDSAQSESEAKTIQYIPGNPGVGLLRSQVHDHLSNELATPLLDELYTHLWLVAKKSGRHIDALHTQKVKGRAIIPTEDPRLHLIWNKNKIYIKPVPLYLVNYEFWVRYLQPLKPVLSSENSSLVPKIPEPAALIGWSIFINHFRVVGDDRVAKRYHYGQLRLSRLNWAVRIFRPQHTRTRWFYENSYWSTGEFMERATFPLVFLFASVSIALSSMQVALAVPVDRLWSHILSDHELKEMSRAFWLFSIAVVLLWLLIWALLLGIPLLVLCSQVFWGLRNREKQVKDTPTV
ncbi:uncharacterized protein N7487_011269 [Penicillium crustosum]|uniref:uncharacterized protein n=1 Tax=Penicillium crustosum TaxID=36656 RepID=UPI0023A70E58|nr:uncharacterized protein N7487_011269 [Penicillium crustosum]KAJ5393628.1 hypothetical protein N7487_011269 [Penicillium crustosum]